MKNEEDIDKLVGDWHAFADQTRPALVQQFSVAGVALLQLVLQKLLGQRDELKFNSADDFAEYVSNLRENERGWSRQLGEVLIKVDIAVKNGDKASAKEKLDEFERTCPWAMFLEVARIQRENLL